MNLAGVVLMILAIVAVTLLFSYSLLRTYIDRRESNVLTNLISTFAISTTLLCVLLIPVDIYIVSSGLNADGSQADPGLTKSSAEALQSVYYSLYILLLIFAFLLIPLSYFYYEEDSEESTVSSRLWSAAKYTAGFVVFFLVLLILGVVLKKGRPDEEQDWKDRLIGDFSNAEAVLSFCVGCLACIGLLGYVVYAAYGLARLPLKLMSRAKVATPSLPTRAPADSVRTEDLELSIRRNQENIQYLQSQYELSGRPWTQQDLKQLNDLKREQRRLQSLRQSRLRTGASHRGDDDAGQLSCWDKCWNFLMPFRLALGIPLLLLSLLLIVSLSISVVDKFKHSDCGPSCGYALSHTRILNPIDEALKQLAKAFPIDCFAFGGMVLYIFLACVSGIVGLGVRFFVFKLYSIQKGRTMPNAFLMAAWLLQLMVLALNMEILTFAPTYSTFGNQFWLNDTTAERHACDMNSIGERPDYCLPTQIGKFINTMGVQTPFFNVILFYGNLGFLFFFLIFLAHGVFFADNSKREEIDEFRRLDDLSD